MLSTCTSLKGFKTDTKPKNECNCYSNFQLHFTALSLETLYASTMKRQLYNYA